MPRSHADPADAIATAAESKADPASDAVMSIEAARGPGRDPHAILLVDDEPAILESLELTLGADYRVFSASSDYVRLLVYIVGSVSVSVAIFKYDTWIDDRT